MASAGQSRCKSRFSRGWSYSRPLLERAADAVEGVCNLTQVNTGVGIAYDIATVARCAARFGYPIDFAGSGICISIRCTSYSAGTVAALESLCVNRRVIGLIVVSLVRVIAPVYKLDDCAGVEPFVV
jgi:hypothetical protein